MLEQIPFLLSRLGMLALLAFLLSQWRTSRHLFQTSSRRAHRLILLSLFVLSGILMNYAGIGISADQTIDPLLGLAVSPDQWIVDTRLTIVVTSGLLGGPVIGGLTGLLVGFHRFWLGSFGAESGWIIAIGTGLLSGLYSRQWRVKDGYSLLQPIGIVLCAVLLDIGVALILATNQALVLELTRQAVFPMLVANVVGVSVFIAILRTQLRLEQELFIRESARSYRLLDAIRPLRKNGMTVDVARQIGATILTETKINRVVLLGAEGILADVRTGQDTADLFQHQTILDWVEDGQIYRSEDKLTHQVVSFHPLHIEGKKAGIVCWFPADLFDDTMERTMEQLVDLLARELITYQEEQLAQFPSATIKPILSTNYLLGIIDEIHQTADPGTPVKHQLGALRQLLMTARRLDAYPLREELLTLKSYLSLEGIRRHHPLTPAAVTIDLDIETAVEEHFVFPLLVTQLVDNALRHAFPQSGPHHRIDVRAFQEGGHWVVEVSDNGTGMPLEFLKRWEQDKRTETSNLFLLRRALDRRYGNDARCMIDSRPGKGTRLELFLPVTTDWS
ncbi:LytS/YhcK type 5TM receptor domain-containing protein [Exiguobacterium antarcticum]|uniref:LytS/YhcK type 5TM receptor domain-containing protein n=1 Tax=Exiguobacterium antarcticum TaxID=132920 RepID=A0ABT6R5C4_9BACL|nr:LytS/YhcK type 5TM receptor domain-containing protein [Exiguobacterium antarcticum]MDI3236038.1 LytS/YhcK type 5TM receptor domain-containing protein [Exiguobacterium antarcticum]